MADISKADTLICGSGITGLTIAKKLLSFGHENITIIEKGRGLGEHASGRNSGVLHAGVYYNPDSLKAKFCHKGNKLMKAYCRANNLPLMETGKVIVAKDEADCKVLEELYSRAVKNGVNIKFVNEEELKEIEPYAQTYKKALYSYDTAVVDPKTILTALSNELISSGKVKILMNTEFLSLKGSKTVITNTGKIEFSIFVNAAGAYSDKIAHSFGVGLGYNLIPFKGIYRKLRKSKSFMVNGNIYPVPDIRNPFLGTHFTKNVHGDVYIGPTAIPAFGRENYGIFSGIDSEVIDILFRDALLFVKNSKFRKVALTEPKKYIFKHFFEDAKRLVKGVHPDDIVNADKVGIRPQLVDWNTKELVMDFFVLKDGNSIHILNAISPAFTSSMAFADYVVDKYI